MGFIVLRMTKIEDKVKYYDASKKILVKKTQNSRCATATFTLNQGGKYCVIPLTQYSNDVQKYTLKLFFHNCTSA